MPKRRTDAREFHEAMKRVYKVEGIFSRNPKLDRYFFKKVHKPLYEVMLALDKNPNDIKALKKALKLYNRFLNFMRMSTTPVEEKTLDERKFVISVPNERLFKKRVGRITDRMASSAALGTVDGIISTYLGYLSARSPNMVNVPVTSILGAATGYNFYKVVKNSRRYNFSIKLNKYIKNKEEFERVLQMMHAHYVSLDTRLRRISEQIVKDKKEEGT